jgi:hypothetical protein
LKSASSDVSVSPSATYTTSPDVKKHCTLQNTSLTQRFPPAWCRYAPIATCPTRFRHCVWPSRAHSPCACRIARAAGDAIYESYKHNFIDAVRLAYCVNNWSLRFPQHG